MSHKAYEFHTADVFTDRLHGGNPLAVITDARGLTDAQMLAITREFNYSESVFVFPATEAGTRRLRIFTSGGELAFAGHPTIGTAFVLAVTGAIRVGRDETRIVLEENIGPVRVLIKSRERVPFCSELTAPQLPLVGAPPPPAQALGEILCLEPRDVIWDDSLKPQALSCGVPFLFVPVRTPEALSRIRVDRERWEKVLGDYWAKEMFVFSTDSWDRIFEGGYISARMFAPALGIGEDPATGSACAALAGFLGLRSQTRTGTFKWLVTQGVEMGRPSKLHLDVEVQNGEVREIRVGGNSVLVSSGTLYI